MGIILITNIMSEPFFQQKNSITTSLVKLAEDGVNLFTTVQLKKYLLILYKKSYGSQSNKTIDADLVFSNMDVYFTYNKLLQKIKAPKKLYHKSVQVQLSFFIGV
jgi:phytoene dehydrogenase-like protein